MRAQTRPAPEISSELEQALLSAESLKRELDEGSGTEEALTEIVSKIETMSASMGMNQIFLDDNDGEFEGIPLSGQTAARLGAPLPLGLLSFGSYQPADLIVEILTDEQRANLPDRINIAGVFKGKGYGHEHAYVLSTPFQIQNSNLKGISRAIGSYSIPKSSSSTSFSSSTEDSTSSITSQESGPAAARMEISFHCMRLEPLVTSAEEVQAWKDIFLPCNSLMDPESGVLDVQLPSPAPGWQEYLLMGRDYQLVMGNAGSKTLLKRILK